VLRRAARAPWRGAHAIKALSLLIRCVTTRQLARRTSNSGDALLRSILERGGAALADAALRAHSGNQAAPPAAGGNPDHTPGAAAALLLCLLLRHDSRAAHASAPHMARTLLAVPRAQLRASGMLAASACGLLGMVHGGAARLQRAQVLNAVDVAVLALRAHAQDVKVANAAVPLLGMMCTSGAAAGGGRGEEEDGDAAAARRRAVAAGAPALLRSAAMARLRVQDPLLDQACMLPAVRAVAAAAAEETAAAQHLRGAAVCDACGDAAPPGGGGLKRCSACLAAVYCSAACQRAHYVHSLTV
jgi:hypothetical protein